MNGKSELWNSTDFPPNSRGGVEAGALHAAGKGTLYMGASRRARPSGTLAGTAPNRRGRHSAGNFSAALVTTHCTLRLDAFAPPQSEGGASGALAISNPPREADRSPSKLPPHALAKPPLQTAKAFTTSAFAAFVGNHLLTCSHSHRAAFVSINVLKLEGTATHHFSKLKGLPGFPTFLRAPSPATHTASRTRTLASATNQAFSVLAITKSRHGCLHRGAGRPRPLVLRGSRRTSECLCVSRPPCLPWVAVSAR